MVALAQRPRTRVLFLGSPDSLLIPWLKRDGNEVLPFIGKLSEKDFFSIKPDCIVSYGYRHIIPASVTKAFDGLAVNLHISYLPFNRGADPNFWSAVDFTPGGVSIHCLDAGIDTGDIIAQRYIQFSLDETLRVTYRRLQNAMEELFRETWPGIKLGRFDRKPQTWKGTYHRSSDKNPIFDRLSAGWDTRILEVRRVACDIGYHLIGLQGLREVSK